MIQVYKPGADEEKSETARMSNFIGAIAIGDLIKSTLGPKGMDKILISQSSYEMGGGLNVTNDGATILRSLGVDNPSAKVLVDMSKVQDEEVGDGTTSVVVFACELLKEAETLVAQQIHPQTIIAGWRLATDAARAALRNSTHECSAEERRESMMNIARTTLGSKILKHHMDHFAGLAVDAVLRLKKSGNLEAIHILKMEGGRLVDSFLDEGFILNKKIGLHQPKLVKDAKILIANTSMDADKIKIFSSRIRVDSMAQVAELELAEKEKMKQKVEKIIAHGCTVFINRQLIYNYPEQLFADSGVLAIEHADFEGVERLALALGGEIVSTFDDPKSVKLGTCESVGEMMLGEDKVLHFKGLPCGEACTIVIRGSTQQIIDEAERSLHDVLCVLTQYDKLNAKIVYGAGCSEMLMSQAVDKLLTTTEGKEAVAVESYARALRQIPTILANNAGFDSADLVAKLRAAHAQNKSTSGLDLDRGVMADVKELRTAESHHVKEQMITSASEAAEMILRVDNIIKAVPRKRERDHCM